MQILLSSKADKQLGKMPTGMHQLLISEIEKLATTPYPSGVRKLVGRECWRLRVGNYRILYTIDRKRKELTIPSVAHRKDAYRLN
ncbi:type II toxin-antitoxin system RelE/ParE family toxin [Candidatus Gottesmanbacteria bacterium]|nr:type II toxin-antitoxin system RelE/ParE family toxin [Candidatus Gottesmanbacteria bacterium]